MIGRVAETPRHNIPPPLNARLSVFRQSTFSGLGADRFATKWRRHDRWAANPRGREGAGTGPRVGRRLHLIRAPLDRGRQPAPGPCKPNGLEIEN